MNINQTISEFRSEWNSQLLTIRRAVKAQSPGLSVTQRGSWIHINRKDHNTFTPDEAAALTVLGLPHGGNFCVISPEERSAVATRLAR